MINVTTSVQITLIICSTLIILLLGSHALDRRGIRLHRSRERLGDYKRFLAALADIKCDAGNKKGWDRLSSASHLVCLTAPPSVVHAVMSCCQEMHETNGPPSQSTATNLLVAFREDLGLPAVTNPESLNFDILPSRWLDHAA